MEVQKAKATQKARARRTTLNTGHKRTVKEKIGCNRTCLQTFSQSGTGKLLNNSPPQTQCHKSALNIGKGKEIQEGTKT